MPGFSFDDLQFDQSTAVQALVQASDGHQLLRLWYSTSLALSWLGVPSGTAAASNLDVAVARRSGGKLG